MLHVRREASRWSSAKRHTVEMFVSLLNDDVEFMPRVSSLYASANDAKPTLWSHANLYFR